MAQYIVRRLLLFVPTLLGVSLAIFLLLFAFRQLAWHYSAGTPRGDADSLIIEATFGFIGGLLAGMLGIGGGAIFVPAIVIFGLTPEADPQKVAQGVSLVVIVATGLLGTFINARQDTIDAWALRWIAVAAVAAALIASLAANAANDRLLQVIYGLTALILGAEMVWSSARGLRARPAVERV